MECQSGMIDAGDEGFQNFDKIDFNVGDVDCYLFLKQHEKEFIYVAISLVD